jgi:tRNA dimethylallyltransferase
VVVAGPTATGKTTLAISLAGELPGAEIVSADSRQVYRGMDIGTAKPTEEERATVPHHGLDLVDPDEPFTAADFRRHALTALADIGSRGGLGFLVGGTGLYLRTVARGLPLDRGDTDAKLRAELEARLAAGGLDTLATELRERDASAAEGIDLHNPRRVVRALERAILTGSARPPEPEGYPAPTLWLSLTTAPEPHHVRIHARVVEHFEAGLLDEADRLRARYPEDLAAFSAMGYREAFDVLAGRCTLKEAIERDDQRTWAYARRQRTWFRSEPDIIPLEVGEGTEEHARGLVADYLGRLDRADYPVGR